MTEPSGPGVLVPLGTGRSLSAMQRSLWVSQLNHPDAPVQNMPLLSLIDGPIDPAGLAAAFASVVAGSDALRTRLSSAAGRSTGPWQVDLIPVDQLPETEIVDVDRADVDRWARARGRIPIDMRIGGFDSAIAVHGDGTISWYLNLHHVITDATSSALVFRATAAAYERSRVTDADRAERPEGGSSVRSAESDPAPDAPPSYYRWARKLADNLDHPSDSATERAIEYWRNRHPASRLGALYQPVDPPTPEAQRLPLPLGPELLRRAEEQLAGDYRMLTDDLAWSTLLVTATTLYCHRVTGATEFAIGLPVHNRRDPAARELIGPTMEVFPVDVAIEPADTFRSLHKRIARAVLTTLRHAAPGTSPVADYEAVVNVIPRADQQRFGSTPASTRWLHSGAIDSSHLLRVQMTGYTADSGQTGDQHAERDPGPAGHAMGPEFALDVNHGGADPAHRRRAAGHFISILSDLVSEPDAPIGRRTVCGPDELDELGSWESTTEFASPTPLTIDRLAAALSGNGSVVLEQSADGSADRSLTGAEVWHWVAAVAGELERRGVTVGARVAVDLPRSIEAVVAIMAIMATGGSFVPLDPSQPDRRRADLAARADCAVVLSSVAALAGLRPDGTATIGTATDGTATTDFRPRPRAGTDEAYLLFTSGSTGEPKGVPITGAGLAHYVRFAEQSYTGDGSEPIAPLFSPLTFDLTITSLFVPILAGGRLVVIGSDGPAGLTEIARRADINWCKATPSHLEILVRLLPPDHRLRTLVVGGEAFGRGLAARLLQFNPEMAIFNEYGPTEAVVGCMLYRLEPDLLETHSEVPIGRPAPGVTLLVVDDHLRRVPIGSPGELCIACDGLTAGYLATADEPVPSDPPSPFVEIDGRRFYRSGDLVRLQDPERLVYLGRKDEQVKVGGIRLEPIEVETRLDAHPAVARSAVRLWSPSASTPSRHCTRCGLPDNVPGVTFDDAGVCETCHAYDRVAPVAESWFKTPEDLLAKLGAARAARTGQHDCVHLLSGGKDSTYALYQLVELGFRPYALTLDNGFISEGAKENVRRSVADLGIDHEFATSDSMNAIFRDSLDRHSNVCHGCYKTIYTLATTRAAELGAPLIVTGLSRGQLFETRLIPQQFSADRFDPDAIDRAVLEARKIYHRVDDGSNRLLDNSIFEADEIFQRIEYLDFYRYQDVELSAMLRFLDERAPWIRPSDTGRSTNCLINAAGIHTHQTEQGYHNYAVPYAWDVRLGHKTRNEAIDELDDRSDQGEIDRMLAEVGYRPRPRQILTAWIEPSDAGAEIPDPAELRSFLAGSLPAHAIPAAFVGVDALPMSANGKLDVAALPAPQRVHRPGPTMQLGVEQPAHATASTDLERSIIDLWERVLQIEPIAPTDDFFAIGGDSLAALEMIVALGDARDQVLGEDLAFTHTTPSDLARAVELLQGSNPDQADLTAFATPVGEPPTRSAGELAVLFDQAGRTEDVMYNVGRVYRVHGALDPEIFEPALRAVATRHQPLSWNHGTPRRPLPSDRAVSFTASREPVSAAELDERSRDLHRRPFDLEQGPLLRCLLQPLEDGTTGLVLAIHHASGDAMSFATLLDQINDHLSGVEPADSPLDYAGFCAWQEHSLSEADGDHWLDASGDHPPATLAVHRPAAPEPDGFATRRASVSAARLRSAGSTSAAAVAIASVAATVRRYSDGPEIELGLIASTRNHPRAEDLFGYFLNTVPLRISCPDDRPSTELATATARAIGGALAHRTYPLARIAADRRAAGRPAPSHEVMVAFDELPTLRLGGTTADQRVLWNGNAVAPLTFFIEVRDEHIELSLEHRGSIVGAAMAGRMLEHLDRTLAEAVGPPRSVESTTVLPADRPGQAELRHETEAEPLSLMVGGPLRNETLVPTRIAGHLVAGGQAEAVICGDEELTWHELGRRAAAVAEVLGSSGVQPGDRVALCLPRSTNLVAAIVGIHLVGAAYVPIDPTYPDERIERVAGRAGALFGLVDDAHRSLVDRPLVLDETGIDGRPWQVFDGFDDFRERGLGREAQGDDPAYVIFTSGSTGEPRGVAVSQRNLASSTNARAGVYPVGPRRFLLLSSVAFDSSIVGLFWTLAEGGTVVLPTEDQAHDVVAIHRLMGAELSHTLMVPTLYQGLITLAGRTEQPEISGNWPDHVIVAGEACPPALIRAHYELFPDHPLTNEYGPTEATVWATAHHCSVDDESVPIGPPIPGSWVAVVDRESGDAVRPDGVEGELIIGGRGVVDGYLDNPEASGARFAGLASEPRTAAIRNAIDDPDGRFFRTGDRAVMVDGRLLFLGRDDDQLNIGGTRAEPEEIEAALSAVDGVVSAVVVAADLRTLPELLESLPADVVAQAMATAATDPKPAAALLDELQRNGEPRLRLVAHLEAEADLDIDRVRQQAASALPPLLRPGHYEIHRSLPTTPNGKLDRRAARLLPISTGGSVKPERATGDGEPDELAAVSGSPTGGTAAEPVAAELVESLSDLFATTLRIERFDPDADFFDHGGHSLLAMELLLAIEDRHRCRLPASAIYAAPSPRALAARLARETTESSRSFLVPIQTEGDRPPVFAIHVLGVNCEFFRPLSARLGPDQPMYGLGQPTTDLDTAGPTSVGDVAAGYAEEIARIAPQGPVSLLAISLGGVVAYELAQQLIAGGRDVALLAMFDALGPDALVNQVSLRNRLQAHQVRLGADPRRYVRDQIENQGLRLERTRERIGLAVTERLEAKAGHRLEIRRFIEENVASQRSYVHDPYPGRMLVVKAGDDPLAPLQVENQMGWGQVATGGLEIEVAHGQHLSIMAEPNVAAVADAVRHRLPGRAPDESTGRTAESTERALIGALRTGRLPGLVARLVGDTLEGEAARLVADVDRVLVDLAETTGDVAATVARQLTNAGLEAEVAPVPHRVQHATASIAVTGDVATATEVLARLDFKPVESGQPAALIATVRATGRIDFIRRGSVTSRIRLLWAEDRRDTTSLLGRLTGKLVPTKRDFDTVELPAWAWAGYWPVRAWRVAGRQLWSRSSPSDGSDPTTTDLGIFLGTPAGLIVPLLRFAEIEQGQTIVDIGCGDGRVLIESATRFGCTARGYETDPELADLARAGAEAAGVGHLVEVIQGDGRQAIVADADIVFAFLPPAAVAEILEPTIDELAPSARFLSHEQLAGRLPVRPDRTGLVVGSTDDPAEGGITVANLWYGRRGR